VKTLFLKYHIEILVVLAALLFITTRHPDSPYDKMIGSDGKGYYAYLPAVFIYGDLNYDFVESYERIYYEAIDDFFDFRIRTESGTINKYFPGVAILWIPFFLLAHVASLLFGFSADGYSLPYQLAIGFAALFYLWLGLKFLHKILQHYKIEDWLSVFVIWIIFFGTNLYYYTIEEPAFTHVYSFALINVFSLTVIRLSKNYQPIGVLLLSITLALIIIIRPVNGIIIFAIPFLSGTIDNLFRLFKNILNDKRTLFSALTVGVAVLLIIPIIWLMQSGQFLVYTYGDEGFNFRASHMLDVMLSYHNGLLIYTPVALISFAGFYPVFKQSSHVRITLFTFLLILVYIVGSWSVWWYGEAFGMRPMIDFYFVIAILLGIWLKFISSKKLIFSFTVVVLVVLTGFNLFQTWQFKNGILPAKNLNQATYWENFLATTPKARVYMDDVHSRCIQTFFTDMETNPGWLNYTSKSSEFAFSGQYASKIDFSNTYSIGFRENISSFLADNNYQVVVSAMAYSGNDNCSAQLVVDYLDQAENSLSYNTFFLHEFLSKNRWTQIEFAATIPPEILNDFILAVYFWNPASDERFFVDDIKIEIWEIIDE